MSQFCGHPSREPLHEAGGGGRGSERGAGHAAICRKNYRPGLIKLFDRLEADTDGRREGRACMPAAWYYSSAAETAAAAAIQFSFRRRRHAHILHTTNDQGWGERESRSMGGNEQKCGFKQVQDHPNYARCHHHHSTLCATGRLGDGAVGLSLSEGPHMIRHECGVAS